MLIPAHRICTISREEELQSVAAELGIKAEWVPKLRDAYHKAMFRKAGVAEQPAYAALTAETGMDFETLTQMAERAVNLANKIESRELRRLRVHYDEPWEFEPSDVSLWQQPVEAPELLASLVHGIQKKVQMSEPAALSVALWALHAHALNCFENTPRLVIRSRGPACG